MCRYLFLICGARVRHIKPAHSWPAFWSDGFTSSGVSAWECLYRHGDGFTHCHGCFNIPAGRTVKVIGPAVKNPYWLQLKADILQCPIEAIAFDETVSLGALLIACPNVVPRLFLWLSDIFLTRFVLQSWKYISSNGCHFTNLNCGKKGRLLVNNCDNSIVR